jgi:WhiB family transcriptional regulator, redox-sensing transcriptional regulator
VSPSPHARLLAALTPGMGDWVEQAHCGGVNPDLFFPERGASTRDAKAVCRVCPVREECLDYALAANERFGIWGGLSERERRAAKRRRDRARRAA